MPVPRRVVLGAVVTGLVAGAGALVEQRPRRRPATAPPPETDALRPLVEAAMAREQAALTACRALGGDPRATALADHHARHVALLGGASPTATPGHPSPTATPGRPSPPATPSRPSPPASGAATRAALAARERSLAAAHLADLPRLPTAAADLAAYLASMAACAAAGAADLVRAGR